MHNRKKEEIQAQFSLRLKELLEIKKISPLQFGKMLAPHKEKSTLGYYFLNAPNTTIYKICKVCVLLGVEMRCFFSSDKDWYEIEIQDVDEYYQSILKRIGREIKEKRKERKDLILDMEVLTHIDSSNLSKLENAKANFSIQILSRIAFMLEVDVGELI